MRKQKQSKFVGKEFDNGWFCSGINIAKATLTHKNGGPTYWYAFEQKSNDGVRPWLRVNAATATKIYKGEITVQSIFNARFGRKQPHALDVNFIIGK